MGEVEYFVTHSAGHILCESISRPLPNGEFEKLTYQDIVDLLNENAQLKQLAEGNEEQLLKVMSYLHDNHYELWEKVNKECF